MGVSGKSIRILICGSRTWQNWAAIYNALKSCPPDTVIIHGGAKGADNIAGHIAKALGFKVEVFEADWNKHGKSAGILRNQRMLAEGKPDFGIAFKSSPISRGTDDMINRFAWQKKPIEIYYDN